MAPINDTKQREGEFLSGEGNDDISREYGVLKSGEIVGDGRALKLVSGKLEKATGSNSSGVSNETIVGYAYGNYDATGGDLKGVVYIARLATVKAELVKNHDVSGGGAAAATTAVLAEMAKRFIVLR